MLKRFGRFNEKHHSAETPSMKKTLSAITPVSPSVAQRFGRGTNYQLQC